MLCIKNYDDLCRRRLWNKKQFWHYVIILNPRDLSHAGKVLLESLDYFHLDSGADCIYFIPGFINTDRGIFKGILDFFKREHPDIINIRNYGDVQFFLNDFIDCVHRLERKNKIRWRYSGECELLLFNIDDEGSIIVNDFSSYNLDDVIRNGRNISTFIRETINVGKDATDALSAKRKLDEIYASLILPPIQTSNSLQSTFVWNQMLADGFEKENYYFISYSSRDYYFVSRIRDAIELAGIKCWMAPRDIPHGTNYAHIIEVAIKNAQQFVIILSSNSIWSVWVEKELQRAIHHFQHESATKILAVWLDRQLELDNTPMAYPIEGIQIIGKLTNVEDYRMLLPLELQSKLKTRDKIEKTLLNFQKSMVSSESIKEQFTRLLGIAKSTEKHIEDSEKVETLNRLCERLKINLQGMEHLDEQSDAFIELFVSSLKIEHQIEHILIELSRV